MKKLILLVSLTLAAQTALATDTEVQNNYKKHYIEQVKPLVIQKLSHDHPEMQGATIKDQADYYASKMAECQLEGLNLFPEKYRDQAIIPVANGESVASTTVAFTTLLKNEIKAGKISKEQVDSLIQNAQQSVQLCVNP